MMRSVCLLFINLQSGSTDFDKRWHNLFVVTGFSRTALLTVFLGAFLMTATAQTDSKFHIAGNHKNFTRLNSDNYSTSRTTTPAQEGIRLSTLNKIHSIVNQGIKIKAFPGCQILVMKDGKTVYNKCFGYYTYHKENKVKPTTMYDLASLSKTTGTLLAIMKLYDEKKLQLTDKASDFLPFLRGTNKADITIEALLFHESGLPAGLPFYQLVIEKKKIPSLLGSLNMPMMSIPTGDPTLQYKPGWAAKKPSENYPFQAADSLYINQQFHQAAMQMIANAPLKSKTYRYSDLNFILLKEIVETITGMPMDQFLNQNFFIPMKMNYLAYLPLRSHPRDEIAPTMKKDFLRNQPLQGYVQDPDAALFGGVSGNAGLFGNAKDVAMVYQMLLNHGTLNGKRFLSAETCTLFTTKTSPDGRRGLGFDKPIPYNPLHSPCAPSAPAEVFGHTGYTGTCCWVDPSNQLIYVFLSNRTYPYDQVNKLARLRIRPKIQEVIYKSLLK
ncbi:MAG: serine hydrolase domain-containing protein [Microbacter sp.]